MDKDWRGMSPVQLRTFVAWAETKLVSLTAMKR